MMDGITILVGDCIASMRELPAQSVHTCVTSPPYFGLRSYLPDDHPDKALELGLESTPAEFVTAMVAVFREVRRVLRDDGTLWLNLGDSYAGSGKGPRSGGNLSRWANGGRRDPVVGEPRRSTDRQGKQLLGIPWRVAFALQDDGWYLRQDIIWHKPNPMPESAADRCTKAHEYIFLLSKGPRYYFDQKAILEPCSPNTHARLSQKVQDQIGSERANGGSKANGPMKAVGRKFDPAAGNKNNPSFDAAMAIMPENRNKRSVWTVTTRPYSGAHFATFPPQLIEPCILAGAPVGGTVLDPFGGSGTTGGMALKLGRKAVLCELNPASVDLMPERIRSIAGHTADLFMRAAE